jgi:hypothetical protein
MKAILNRRAQKIKNLPERRLQRFIKEARHNIEELRGLYHAEGLSVWEKKHYFQPNPGPPGDRKPPSGHPQRPAKNRRQ